jgi:hypothetical protein
VYPLQARFLKDLTQSKKNTKPSYIMKTTGKFKTAFAAALIALGTAIVSCDDHKDTGNTSGNGYDSTNSTGSTNNTGGQTTNSTDNTTSSTGTTDNTTGTTGTTDNTTGSTGSTNNTGSTAGTGH